ncbi:MAG: hypothetical protein CMQ40_04260 [Gammaproteobacteria bacterium]|nr:hypothetical protein [Gammaproteobacteria bacterium]
MNFIIVSNRTGRHQSFRASLGFIIGFSLIILLGSGALGYYSYKFFNGDSALTSEMVVKWRHEMEVQRRYVERLKQDAELKLEASAVRIAQLQARIVRLDALGERLTKIGRFKEGEFDFSNAPAMGGPEKPSGVSAYKPPAYIDLLDKLAKDIEDREQQLGVLQVLMSQQKMDRDKFIAGRPVKKGWMSSRYGNRIDPITGKRAWHEGVDFAGKQGADVIAVAAGVVVFSGQRSGYGRMVEINHGGGYATRYGHHAELSVTAGDIVRRGQVIGLMGSSGRSTGPHVHFEVLKNGQVVDPSKYIYRTSR